MNRLLKPLAKWRLYRGKVRLLLLAYGVALCVFGAQRLATSLPDHAVVMEYRADHIARSIYVLERGGPPLLASFDQFERWSEDQPQVFPIGAGDDQGYFLYLPLMGHILGLHDPYLLSKWFAIGLFVPLLLLYALAFAEAFDSILAGLVAPILLIRQFDFVLNTELYFATAWAILMGLPGLILIHRRWGRVAAIGLFLIVLLAAFANTIRFQAGLPILLAAVVVVLLNVRRRRSQGVLVLALIALFALANQVPALAAKYRDAVVGTPYGEIYRPEGRTLWHSAYIALGYLPNEYGIRFDDAVAFDAVERTKAGVPYQSRDYDEILRGLFLDLVRRDPGFIVSNVAAKSIAILAEATTRFGAALVVLPLALYLPFRRRGLMRVYVALALPALAVTYAANVLYMPYSPYNIAWLSVWGYLWLLGAAWLFSATDVLAAAAAAAKRIADIATTTTGRRRLANMFVSSWRARLFAILLVVIVVILLAAREQAERVASIAYYQQSAGALVQADQVLGPIRESWVFEGSLPGGWEVFPGVRATPGHPGVEIRTNQKKLEYQLWSGGESLPPGRYTVVADARVIEGGLYVGVLDTLRGVWLATSYYWYGQDGYESKRMVTTFETTTTTSVRVVFSNWAPTERSSRWILREVRIVDRDRG